jgi:threonine/homoserine/homoserine lactone efflux protein
VELAQFAAEVVAVSASGVLAPGPLFAANVLYGAAAAPAKKRGMLSGIRVAHGHAVVEMAVVCAIAAGLFSASSLLAGGIAAGIISMVGGMAILGFAAAQAADAVRKKRLGDAASVIAGGNDSKITVSRRRPFAAGAALTAFNPFFLAWWLTVGLKLISDSAASFGPVAGVAVLFSLHVWMDYAWLAATAYLASRGSSSVLLNSKYYWVLVLALAALLAYYGVQSLLGGIKLLGP